MAHIDFLCRHTRDKDSKLMCSCEPAWVALSEDMKKESASVARIGRAADL